MRGGVPRHTACRELIDQSHYEGESMAEVAAPTPLGEWGRAQVAPRSWELAGAALSRGIERYQRILEANR